MLLAVLPRTAGATRLLLIFPLENCPELPSRRGHQCGVVVDDIQMTTTLIILVLQLIHHFIEGTDIDTTDVNTMYNNSGTVLLKAPILIQLMLILQQFWYCPTVQLLVLLPCGSMEYTIFIMLRQIKQNSYYA
jgi:hypothetical protein